MAGEDSRGAHGGVATKERQMRIYNELSWRMIIIVIGIMILIDQLIKWLK